MALLADSYYALAVDLARKGCTVGLCDIGGNLLQCRELPEQSDMTDAIAGALASLLESVDRRKVLGIGISAPGPLDCENGCILNPPRFEQWHGMDIGKRLSDALGLPAYLEHDVCAMALHQRSTGQSRNFMLLFIDIGIGAAIVSGGELLGNFTGELGHTTIRFDGRLCACGNGGVWKPTPRSRRCWRVPASGTGSTSLTMQTTRKRKNFSIRKRSICRQA